MENGDQDSQITVSNAFRLLGSGEPPLTTHLMSPKFSLKCLSAFGFWGTIEDKVKADKAATESQMPFGFWVLGNRKAIQQGHERRQRSQMPFGFWVLGNPFGRCG